jgi:hypothetical protein
MSRPTICSTGGRQGTFLYRRPEVDEESMSLALLLYHYFSSSLSEADARGIHLVEVKSPKYPSIIRLCRGCHKFSTFRGVRIASKL